MHINYAFKAMEIYLWFINKFDNSIFEVTRIRSVVEHRIKMQDYIIRSIKCKLKSKC